MRQLIMSCWIKCNCAYLLLRLFTCRKFNIFTLFLYTET